VAGQKIEMGVLMARKGGVPKERILNVLSHSQFRAHLQAHKRGQTCTAKRRATTECKPIAGGQLAR
jgi:hypothetical protein